VFVLGNRKLQLGIIPVSAVDCIQGLETEMSERISIAYSLRAREHICLYERIFLCKNVSNICILGSFLSAGDGLSVPPGTYMNCEELQSWQQIIIFSKKSREFNDTALINWLI
jgi:hypothetical protein